MYTSFEELGKALRECRESLGLQAEDVAAQLKIRIKYINAMEKGEFHLLPGTLYAEGHLKSYSRFLKLNEADLLQSFRDLNKVNQKQEQFALPDHFANDMRPPSMLAYVTLGLAFAVYGLWYFMHDSEASPNHDAPVVTAPVMQQEKAEATQPMADGSVVLLATGTAQITLTSTSGEVVSSFTMQAGDTFFVPGRQDLLMQVSDEQAVDIFVEGEEVSDLSGLRREENRIALNLQQLKAQIKKTGEQVQ